MEIDVTSIIVEKLSRNRGPDPLNPDNRIVPDSERPCWYAFKPARAQEYQISTIEAFSSGNA